MRKWWIAVAPWREAGGGVLRILLAMLVGGGGVLWYLTAQLDPVPLLVQTLHDRWQTVFFCVVGLEWLVGVRWGDAPADPSPAASGTWTVVGVGAMSTLALYLFGEQQTRLLYAAMSLVVTIVGAALIYRFARAHAGSIGEARFTVEDSNRQASMTPTPPPPPAPSAPPA